MSKKYNRLWIAEKPSAAKGLITGLCAFYSTSVKNQGTAMKNGFTELANGDVVSSVFGHMVQMQPPSRYLSKEQNSDLMSALPLLPDPFLFEPIPERNKDGSAKTKGGKPVPSERFLVLERLAKASKTIVNACDIDREGQLIFDELMDIFGIDPYADNIQRIALVSFTDEALKKTIQDLEPNSLDKWKGKGAAAATRQKMDWLLGMNASMAYQVITGQRTMSVGRVQTPVLNLVVERDLAIENFKPKAYYIPVVVMRDGTRFRWDKRIGYESEPGFDESGRIIDKAIAQAIVDKIKAGLSGEVVIVKGDEKRQAPPLPYSMGALQSEASKKNGLKVDQVTKAAQNLYEKHKAITYVGTDCRYIPEEMHLEAKSVLHQLGERYKEIASGGNPSLKSKAFDDKKIEEHFAIIPTGVIPNFSSSESAEKAVFDTICNRYMAQFYPAYRYQTAVVTISFGSDHFKASARADIELGWKEVEGHDPDEDEDSDQNESSKSKAKNS